MYNPTVLAATAHNHMISAAGDKLNHNDPRVEHYEEHQHRHIQHGNHAHLPAALHRRLRSNIMSYMIYHNIL